MNLTADVLVVGGGPAGAALSLRVARAGGAVVLLERGDFDKFRIGESLPPAAAPRLKRLGVWDAFLQTRPSPVYGVQSAWGTDDLDSSSFLGNPSLNGWHLDRLRFDAMLASAAEDAGARVLRCTRAQHIEPAPGGHWSVTASSTQGDLRIVSRFVVDATGRHAELCRRLGIGRRREDRLIGIAGILWAEEALGEPLPSRIEAHPLGWWYSAGLPGGCVIAVFFTDADLSARTRLANPRAWRRLLGESRHTFDRLAACIPCGSIRVFPATSHCLDCAAGASWLAVGDALIGRDPLSSSGIDFALASAERASSVLCALANGSEESAATYNAQVSADFAAYMRQRRAHYAIESRWPNSPFWQRRHPSSADGESPKYGTELA